VEGKRDRRKAFGARLTVKDRRKAFGARHTVKDQIRKAAVSMPSNIAEGNDLHTDKQAVNYFYIARGSSAEVLTQAIISLEINYIGKNDFDHIENECKAVSGMLTRLIKARSKA